MENSKQKPVDKNSTINSLLADSPTTFNGMVDALEGLADITESGIERLIGAVNGLSNAATTSNNADAVKQAAITAVARSIASSERIDGIEIKDEPESGAAPLKIERKPVSVDIEKALASIKSDGSRLYQPSPSTSSTVINNNNSHVSSANSSTSEHHSQFNSTKNANAGGRKTVFNQLNEVQATQSSTLDKISNIENSLESTTQAAPEVKRAKAATIGTPKFDRSHIKNNTSKIVVDKSSDVSNVKASAESEEISSKITDARQAERLEKTTNNNTTALSDSATKTSSQIKSTASEIRANSEAISDLSETIKSQSKATNSNAKTVNNNSHKDSARVEAKVNSLSTNKSDNRTSKQKSEVQATSKTTNNEARLKLESVKPNNLSKYYRDSNNRLRTDTGRYASKEETNNYTNAQKTKSSGSIRSSIANHLKDNRKRQTLGYAFNGSVFGAIEEAMQAAQMAKFEVQSRGLTSVDGVKKYVEKKKQNGVNRVKGAADTAAGAATSAAGAVVTAKDATSNAFNRVKNRFFGNKDNSTSNTNTALAGGANVIRNNKVGAVNTANSIDSLDSSITSIDTENTNKAGSSSTGYTSNAGSKTSNTVNNSKVINTTQSESAKTTNNTTSGITNNNKSTAATTSKKNSSVSELANESTQANSTTKQVANSSTGTIKEIDQSKAVDSSSSSNESVIIKASNSQVKESLLPASRAKKTNPSTVDGLETSTATSLVTNDKSSHVSNAIENYLKRNSSSKVTEVSPQKARRKSQPLTNSVFIGAQKSTDGLTKKLSKEYHDSHMLKLDKLIKEVSEVSVNVSGGGSGGMLDDLMDLNKKRKRRKRRKGRSASRGSSRLGNGNASYDSSKAAKKPVREGRLSRAKSYVKGGKFFGGGAKVAGAIGAGAVGAGAIGASAGAVGATGSSAVGATGSASAASKAGGVAGGAAKLGSGALVGAGKLLSKAIPILAIASTAYDAYDGFTNKEKQQETFNLKSTEEANLGQKSAMAAGSVLDLGGLTSGAAGLLGDGLGALGFEGAKEALTFDSGDIAKAIYDKSETLINSGSGAVSSLVEGDFTGAASNAMTFLKTALPTFGMFTDKEESTTEKSTVSASDKSNSESLESSGDVKNITSNDNSQINSATNESQSSTNAASVNNSQDKISAVNSSASTTENKAAEKSNSSPFGYTQGMTIKERIKARKERLETKDTKVSGEQIENGLTSSNLITPISSGLAPQSQATSLTKREAITDVSTIRSSTSTNNSNAISGGNGQQQKGETIVVSDNAKTIAALKEISRKLDLNRKTDKPNNGASSVGINSMPKNIPSEFSDPIMERLANE